MEYINKRKDNFVKIINKQNEGLDKFTVDNILKKEM